MAKQDNLPQEASLSSSARKGKQITTVIGLAEAVEMLNSAIWYYQKAGGTPRIGNSSTQPMTAILALPGIQMCQKCHNLKLFEDMGPAGLCQACQKDETA